MNSTERMQKDLGKNNETPYTAGRQHFDNKLLRGQALIGVLLQALINLPYSCF